MHELCDYLTKYDQQDMQDITAHVQLEVLERLKGIILMVSLGIKDLRDVKLRLNLGIQKFLTCVNATGDWRKSRYTPVIISLKVAKHNTEQAIETSVQANIEGHSII
jgi:hypothetical protein